MRKWALSAALVAAALLVGQEASAQVRTSGSSSGMFGSRSLGSAQTGAGSNFSGGGSRAGGGQGGGQGTGAGATDTGSLSGDERFVRGNRQAGQFVGADTTDLESFVGVEAAAAGQGGRGGMSGQGGRDLAGLAQQFGGQRNQGNAGGRNATAGQGTLRTVRRVAFDVPRRANAQVSVDLATRLRRLPRTMSASPIVVAAEGRTVVLRGVVATDHDRVLAERVARLEPGVSRVVNELLVAPPATEIQELPLELP